MQEILLTILCDFEGWKSSNYLKPLSKTKISTTKERILWDSQQAFFCLFFFFFLFSLFPCFKQHGPHSHMIYYKNLRAKGLFWLSSLRALKGHPEKSQLEEPWNSCGEMAGIWKRTALADTPFRSLNFCSPMNTSLFNFSHRGEYRALVVEFISFNSGFCLHLITLAHKRYYQLKQLSPYLLVLKAI